MNKVIPSILESVARAKRGVDASELIVDPVAKKSRGVKEDVKKAGGEAEVVHTKRRGQGKRKSRILDKNGDGEEASAGRSH